MKTQNRNDKCACGSRLKYKNCCMKKESYENYFLVILRKQLDTCVGTALEICKASEVRYFNEAVDSFDLGTTNYERALELKNEIREKIIKDVKCTTEKFLENSSFKITFQGRVDLHDEEADEYLVSYEGIESKIHVTDDDKKREEITIHSGDMLLDGMMRGEEKFIHLNYEILHFIYPNKK